MFCYNNVKACDLQGHGSIVQTRSVQNSLHLNSVTRHFVKIDSKISLKMPITNFANNTVKIDLQGHGSIVQTRRVKNLCHVKKRPDCCIWKEGRNPTRLADYHFPQQRRQGYNIRGAVTIGFTAKSIAKTRPNYYYTCHGFQTLMEKNVLK